MPKLPELQQRSVANAVYQPVNAPSRNAELQAQSNLGQSLQNLGGALVQIKENRDQFNYNAAKSDFYRQQIELENSLQSETNYETRLKNFDEGISKIRNTLSDRLGDNKYKRNFEDNILTAQQDGRNKLITQAKAQQEADQLAQSAEIEEQNLDYYTRTTNPEIRDALIKSTVDTYASSIPLDDTKRDLKIKEYSMKVGERFAMKRLNGYSPEEQIRLLKEDQNKANSNFTSMIPSDKRQDLLQKAEMGLKQKKDQTLANLKLAEELRKRQAEDTSFKIVNEGGTVEDIAPETWFLLDNKTRDDLNTLQLQRTGMIRLDPIEGQIAFNKYSDMYAQDPQALANTSPIEIQKSVLPNRVQEVLGWRQKAIDGIDAPASFGEQNTILSQSYTVLNIKQDEQKAKFSQQYLERIKSFKEAQGKEPTTDQLRTIANQLVADVSTKGTFFGTNEKPFYKIEDKTKIVVPDDFSNELLTQAQQAGISTLNPEQIRQAYINKLNDVK